MMYTVLSAVDAIVELVQLLGRAVQKHRNNRHRHMHLDRIRRNSLGSHRHLRLYPLPHSHSNHQPRRRTHQTC